MSDLIEREIILDAIDEIESEVADGDGFQYEKWRRYFCELPSAQPEPLKVTIDYDLSKDEYDKLKQAMRDTPIMLLPSTQPEIILCKDCEHWKNEHLCESLSRFGSFETKADFYCGFACKKVLE